MRSGLPVWSRYGAPSPLQSYVLFGVDYVGFSCKQGEQRTWVRYRQAMVILHVYNLRKEQRAGREVRTYVAPGLPP